MKAHEPNTDWQQPFWFDDFISIDSHGGNIGRLTWINQSQMPSYSLHFVDGELRSEEGITEAPGATALIRTLGQWRAWLLGA